MKHYDPSICFPLKITMSSPILAKAHSSVKILHNVFKCLSGILLIIPNKYTNYQGPSSNRFQHILLANLTKCHNSWNLLKSLLSNLLTIPYQLINFQPPCLNTFSRYLADKFKMAKFANSRKKQQQNLFKSKSDNLLVIHYLLTKFQAPGSNNS